MSGILSDVGIVGGGAAGMMAAVAAARAGASVTVYEPMRVLGRKLRITGKGRCNVTNCCPPAEVLENVTKNPKFLKGAVFRFPPERVMDFFEEQGVPLKVERGQRVFPVSDRAADIAGALERAMHALGVRVVQEKVAALLLDGADGCVGVRTGTLERRHGAVIVATGGLSYPATGSTGDGFRFARQAGLRISPPVPSLVPVETAEDTAEEYLETAENLLNTESLPRNGYYAFVCEKCAPVFGHYGWFVTEAELKRRAEEINDRT